LGRHSDPTFAVVTLKSNTHFNIFVDFFDHHEMNPVDEICLLEETGFYLGKTHPTL
jgi:hypothetical protein